MTTTKAATVYLIESTGETRAVWGPYSEGHARREAGVRHFLATGAGLENGGSMTRGELNAALRSGRVRPVDAIAIDAIA